MSYFYYKFRIFIIRFLFFIASFFYVFQLLLKTLLFALIKDFIWVLRILFLIIKNFLKFFSWKFLFLIFFFLLPLYYIFIILFFLYFFLIKYFIIIIFFTLFLFKKNVFFKDLGNIYFIVLLLKSHYNNLVKVNKYLLEVLEKSPSEVLFNSLIFFFKSFWYFLLDTVFVFIIEKLVFVFEKIMESLSFLQLLYVKYIGIRLKVFFFFLRSNLVYLFKNYWSLDLFNVFLLFFSEHLWKTVGPYVISFIYFYFLKFCVNFLFYFSYVIFVLFFYVYFLSLFFLNCMLYFFVNFFRLLKFIIFWYFFNLFIFFFLVLYYWPLNLLLIVLSFNKKIIHILYLDLKSLYYYFR